MLDLLRVAVLELGRSQDVVDVVHHLAIEHHRAVLLVALTTHARTHTHEIIASAPKTYLR